MEKANEKIRSSMHGKLAHLMHCYTTLNFKTVMELGLHPGQMPVMGLLRMNPGMRSGELAEALHIKPPTMTVTIQRLEKAGMVCRREDEENPRITRIYLTKKGQEVSTEIEKYFEESEKILLQGFEESEKEQLCAYLKRMTENLIRAGENRKESEN